jgi:hypothetical protein
MNKVSLLDYCVTLDPVHLVVAAPAKERISDFTESLEGDFAQCYNVYENQQQYRALVRTSRTLQAVTPLKGTGLTTDEEDSPQGYFAMDNSARVARAVIPDPAQFE